jgi:hypothetical protein
VALLEQLQQLVGDLTDYPEIAKRIEPLTSRRAPVLPEQQLQRVQALANLALRRHRRPNGSYHLLFELDPDTRLKLSADSGLFPTAVQLYEFLADMQARGVLNQADLILRKGDLPDELLDRHLSDGEYELLSRIALFRLLDQPESLFLLDEPETHFNDVWKRELVSLLASVVGPSASSTVILSTHSSIVVSDVPRRQITLLRKDENGRTEVAHGETPTLGADPSEIMVQLMGAPDSLGQDASSYLDEQLQRNWTAVDRDELEQLIRTVGPGYHRSELRTIWRRFNAPSD